MVNILYLHAGAELYGADIVLLQLLKGLDKEKYTPHVILPCDGPLVEKLKEQGIAVKVIDYPILRRKYFNIKGMINYASGMIKSVKLLKQYCLENDIKIIHTNTSAVLEGAMLKRKLNIKHIWHIHEIITSPKIIFKFLSYMISKYSDSVVAVSEATKGHLIESGYFKKLGVNVIYNGVDNNKFNDNKEFDYIKKEYGISDDLLVVGMIGRVNSWKGQEDFLKALQIVLSKRENAIGVLVGGVFEGEEWRMENIKAIREKSEFSSRIIIDDYRSDTPNIHAMFDIFVLPSVRPDPLPTVVLEAMATAKPVVAYRHGGVTEMVVEGYNGLFAEVNNPNDLADKILKLIDDNSLRKSMGENSKIRQCESFSLSSYISNFEKLYDGNLN